MWIRSTSFCVFIALLLCCVICHSLPAEEQETVGKNFSRDQLVAWCIVPFDAAQRSPAERAEMVKSLGLRRVAYDWRAEHVATFEDEIQQYQQHGIEFFAFWSWHDALEPLIRKYDIHPQIWITNPSPEGATQSERVQAAVRQLLPLVERTRKLDCSLGLYNHGGWGGEPENLVAVCRALREQADAAHVGIVYNFHHGHEHIASFAERFALMQPDLLCLNLNGMADADRVRKGQDKILPIGEGEHESGMIQVVLRSGYSGPIGILDHRSAVDARESLQQNLTGLKRILPTIQTNLE